MTPPNVIKTAPRPKMTPNLVALMAIAGLVLGIICLVLILGD
jgi:hypothetical protein